MRETLSRTSLRGAAPGSRVNLERALALGDRLGGHIVSGHIDGTGKITSIRQDGIARLLTVAASPRILRLIVEKGSVAIDGISLTVVSVTKSDFTLSVIPHTMANTVLPLKREGDIVNIENDCIGKYVEKLLPSGSRTGVTAGFLAENGFF